MSNGAPAALAARRSGPVYHEDKITYQKCSACFCRDHADALYRTDRL